MKFLIKNHCRGFTVAELAVATGVFTILMSIAVGGFISALKNQRLALAMMAVNDSASLTLEQMAREIRTGYNFCTKQKPIPVFLECSNLNDNELLFVNDRNQVVLYRLNNGAIERGIEDQLTQRTYQIMTAENVNVKNFRIEIKNNLLDDNLPTRVIISMSLTSAEKEMAKIGFTTDIQTTISPRKLDVLVL